MKSNKLKNISISFESIVSAKLKKKQINEICLLKDKEWKFGIKSQINWFDRNIKRDDVHNLLYIDNKLIGYTLLRKRFCKFNNITKKKTYLLFDTLVIDKKFRKNGYSKLLMNFNNKIIKKKGLFSFLICKKKLVNFYIKNGWKKLNKNKINIIDYKFSTFGLIFNNNQIYEKYFFNLNK
jgi:GNAT superfamily N-acetyltransferase